VPVEEEPHAPGRRLTNSAGPEFTDSGNDGTRLVKASTVGHRIKSPRLPSRRTLGLWDQVRGARCVPWLPKFGPQSYGEPVTRPSPFLYLLLCRMWNVP
jgi:hypothetical protein